MTEERAPPEAAAGSERRPAADGVVRRPAADGAVRRPAADEPDEHVDQGARADGSDLTVRRASAADARGIARVHVKAWREAYAGVFSPYLLENLDVTTRTSRWERIIASGTDVWVAESGGRIVGWASASEAREADGPAPLELRGIYVLREHYGTGAGQRVLDASLGDSAAYLWVLADNPRAQAFYRRNGFVLDGTAKVETFGGEPAHEVRMVRPARR